MYARIILSSLLALAAVASAVSITNAGENNLVAPLKAREERSKRRP